MRSQSTRRKAQVRGLDLEKSLGRRREGPEHLTLHSGLEGRRIKTDGFAGSDWLINGQDRPWQSLLRRRPRKRIQSTLQNGQADRSR